MRRTNVYIDGFNLYNGAVKQAPAHKWVDLRSLATELLRGHEIVTVKYFTARVHDRDDDPGQSQRQDVYIRALETVDVEVHFGSFKKRRKKVLLRDRGPDGQLRFDIADLTVEKGSDVALASNLVFDAAQRQQLGLEAAFVISNDSDLQVAVDMARRLGMEVIVANPHRHAGQKNHLFGDEHRNLRQGHFLRNQLPQVVRGHDGRNLTRPGEWGP